MTRRPGRGATALLLALACAAPVRAAVLDYLYVEPDVGDAAGGHVGLRLGDDVYHFQSADGVLRLARHDWDWFRWTYSVHQNRPIHVARVRASADTFTRLRGAFDRRFAIERKHVAVQAALRDDVRLLTHLADCARREGACVDAGLRLRGAGYFSDEADGGPRGAGGPLDALGTRVLAERGPAFLAERIAVLRRALEGLEPPATPVVPAVRSDVFPNVPLRLSERHADLALELLALRALAEGRRVVPGALRTSPADEFVLTPAEIDALSAFADVLARDLVVLLGSSRPDRGYPLLAGMARLSALAETLASGRLVVLDTFPADAAVLPAAGLRRRAAFAEELRARAARQLRGARAALTAGGPPGEREYQRLEEAANRWDEIDRGLREGRDVRLAGDTLLPARGVARVDLPRPFVAGIVLAGAIGEAETAARAHDAELRRVFAYDLRRRNCVSEIFATIDAALGTESAAARLGGRVDPRHALAWVPAVSYRAVLATWNVAAEGTVPSYRQTHLAELSGREPALAVALREASTLTSTVYRANDRDAFFLFFTDGAPLLRPLLGAANVAAGAGQAALGVLRAPFDRGRTLWTGVKGIVYSVPELAFVSLRKGTLDYPLDEAPRTALRLRPGGDA